MSSAQLLGLAGLRTGRNGKIPARSTVIGALAGIFAWFNRRMMTSWRRPRFERNRLFNFRCDYAFISVGQIESSVSERLDLLIKKKVGKQTHQHQCSKNSTQHRPNGAKPKFRI